MGEPPSSVPQVAVWTGELLWPQDLPTGDVIDLAGVTALGAWTYAWLRARPGQAATGASPRLKRQLQRAGVAVLWCDHPQGPTGGVSASERAMLWGDG